MCAELVLCAAVGHVSGPLVLSLMAGGCVGAMAAEMTHFLNGTNLTELTAKMENGPDWSLKSTAYVTYMCLLVAILASATGVLCGHEVHNLVKGLRWGQASGRSFALATPAAALGVAVAGASLGAFPEKLMILDFPSFPLELPGNSLAYQTGVIIVIFCLLLIVKRECVLLGLFMTLVITCVLLFHSLTCFSGFVPLLDLDSIFPLFFVSMLMAHKGPLITSTLLCVAMHILPYQGDSGPSDSSEYIALPSRVLKRLFVVMLAIQMFQSSCAAALHSHFVDVGAGKVCTSALASTAGVLLILLKVSPMIGTGSSLGGLLAASGATGVALAAAGDLGQKDGGHVGRVGAVIGAAVGAFLPLLAQDMRFGIMVALCAAAIPGTPNVWWCLDFLYHLHPRWHLATMCAYVLFSLYVRAFFWTEIYLLLGFHFTVLLHRIGLVNAILAFLLQTRLTFIFY